MHHTFLGRPVGTSSARFVPARGIGGGASVVAIILGGGEPTALAHVVCGGAIVTASVAADAVVAPQQ